MNFVFLDDDEDHCVMTAAADVVEGGPGQQGTLLHRRALGVLHTDELLRRNAAVCVSLSALCACVERSLTAVDA